MKALTYHGRHDIRYGDVPDPAVSRPTDAVVQVTTAGICGSDLHIYGGNPFSPELGYTPGHEQAAPTASARSFSTPPADSPAQGRLVRTVPTLPGSPGVLAFRTGEHQ
ncbi:alcohol dehydrogenase catalytic domain-containing protein [Streptomyces sp. HC307]|uniref:alcohol dehydrogenase catalytic domain-containing protein n=1 Tax=Streptomyces flavusporus TaxID=3385496 RepID=UPI003916F9F3